MPSSDIRPSCPAGLTVHRLCSSCIEGTTRIFRMQGRTILPEGSSVSVFLRSPCLQWTIRIYSGHVPSVQHVPRFLVLAFCRVGGGNGSKRGILVAFQSWVFLSSGTPMPDFSFAEVVNDTLDCTQEGGQGVKSHLGLMILGRKLCRGHVPQTGV